MKENMSTGRAKQRIAHTIDNIGGRDLPHAQIHLQDALHAKTMKETRDHIGRALGHIKEASEQSGMLSGAIKTIPGVVKEAQRLEKVREVSDGLVNGKKATPKLKSKSSQPKSRKSKNRK